MGSKITLLLVIGFISTGANAADFQIQKTRTETEFGMVRGKADAPLALIFTTDIADSLTDKFSSMGGALAKEGFTVASIDIPCHGKDIRKGEVPGLDCWRSRIEKTEGDLFAPYAKKISDVVSQIIRDKYASPSFIVAIGISRGGYLAIRAAAADSRIQYIVAMAPVTDLQVLEEFKGLPLDKRGFNLNPWYSALSNKSIFLQIGNSDDRVGTQAALDFLTGVVKAAGDRPVDITGLITPNKGHATARHDLAAQWIFSKAGLLGPNRSLFAAP